MFTFEQKAWDNGYRNVAGIDEAGRGPLAGPVVAAAVVLPLGMDVSGINDSKKLTPKMRNLLYEKLTTTPEVVYGVGIIDHLLIDEINILQATIRAMLSAAEQIPFDFLLVDGLALPLPCEKIIKGDQRSFSIAAASIIAKVTRDRLMEEADQRWPEYGFSKHKGYGTKVHMEALKAYGPCPIHRKTFRPVADLL
jgi:ribonuclease HII